MLVLPPGVNQQRWTHLLRLLLQHWWHALRRRSRAGCNSPLGWPAQSPPTFLLDEVCRDFWEYWCHLPKRHHSILELLVHLREGPWMAILPMLTEEYRWYNWLTEFNDIRSTLLHGLQNTNRLLQSRVTCGNKRHQGISTLKRSERQFDYIKYPQLCTSRTYVWFHEPWYDDVQKSIFFNRNCRRDVSHYRLPWQRKPASSIQMIHTQSIIITNYQLKIISFKNIINIYFK